MANRDFNNVQAPESEVKFIQGTFTVANGADGTAPTGCIVAAARNGEGDYDLTLKDGYAELLWGGVTVDGTVGDDGYVDYATADIPAKALSVTLFKIDGTSGKVVDDMDAKVVHVLLMVRNSTSRRGS